MRKCYSDYNITKFVIGSGGSAFSDGGLGAVQALEVFDFFDKEGKKVTDFVPFGLAKEVLGEAKVKDE